MIARLSYLILFISGLALAVHAMLHGAERWRRRSGRPSPALNPPTVAAMLVGFGMCGYLLDTRSEFGAFAELALATLTSIAAFAGMSFLMARWALRDLASLPSDESEINGQVASVSRTITPASPGEITYFAWDRKHVLPATSLDGSAIPEGTEVVIDTVEDGVARVELWSVVEQRL
jgi:hypothetical protein